MRVLLGWFAFGARLSLRLCWGGLRSVHACCEVLLTRFALVHACCLSFDKQDGLRYLAFLFRRSRSPFVRSRGAGAVICLGGFTSSLYVYLWRSRRGYRRRGNAGNGRTGLRGWRRGTCALLRRHIGFVMLSAGSTLGLRAPDCAKESSTLWTLFTLRRGCVGAYSRRRRPGTRKAPPGSDLWPGGSGCILMLPARSIVQTRAAPKRRGVGLRARSGEEAAQRLLWTLFTLRRGYVGTNTHPCKKRKRSNQRTHACKTLVHG